MKKYMLLMLIFALLYSCQESKNSTSKELEIEEVKSNFDRDKELELIMNVIDSETKCLYERNYDCWKKNWIHEKYTSHTYNESDGTYNAQMGWERINEEIGSIIVNKPVKNAKSLYPIVERRNIQARFLGDSGAYLSWVQYQNDGKQALYQKSQEIRVMEKVGGKWKIVNLSTFWDYENMIPFENE